MDEYKEEENVIQDEDSEGPRVKPSTAMTSID